MELPSQGYVYSVMPAPYYSDCETPADAAPSSLPWWTLPLLAVSAASQGSLQSASFHRAVSAPSVHRFNAIPVIHRLGVYRVLEWLEQACQLTADVQVV